MDQAFPFCFCILQAIKNWMIVVGRPGNKASTAVTLAQWLEIPHHLNSPDCTIFLPWKRCSLVCPLAVDSWHPLSPLPSTVILSRTSPFSSDLHIPDITAPIHSGCGPPVFMITANHVHSYSLGDPGTSSRFKSDLAHAAPSPDGWQDSRLAILPSGP